MRSATVLHFLGWILLIWNGCSFEVHAIYQTKQTGSRGDRLYIGSLYPIPTFHKTMPTIAHFGIQCTPGEYQDHFTLGIYKIPDRYYEDGYEVQEGEIAVTSEVQLSDYFLTVYRGAWLCKPAGMPDLTEEFVSIDTVLISIKDIFSIRYEDGVEVNLKKFDVDRLEVIERLCVAKDAVNNTFSIPFKCLDDWDYEQETVEISHIPDLAEKILKNWPGTVHHEEEYYEDIPVRETSTPISDNGLSLRIEPSPSTIGKSNKKYVCQPSFVNTELFLPKCYQKIAGHYALIPQEEFGKRFIIVNRDVQICESEKNDRVFRISHTVIGRTNISNIEYGNGIIELYAIELPNGGKSIRYMEVRNFDAKTRKPVMDHNIQYTFAIIKRFRSSVAVETDGSFEPIDIDFKLPPRSIYRVLISPEGYNLRVGSRPVVDIDADDVMCRTWLFNNHKIEYGVNIEIITVDQNGLRHTLVHDSELIHIDKWDQIVYSCVSLSDQSLNFLRVINYLVITKSPIHYIETYDGVEFIRYREKNGKYTLDIIEVKYLSNGMAVRFVGKFKAHGDIMRSDQIGSMPEIIRKGEIYPLPNTDVPTREHISRDYQWNGEQYERFENEKNMERTMLLKVNRDSNLATNQPEVIICKAKETLVERFPFFKIMKETTEIELMSSDTDRTFNEKYFDNIKSEKWLCREIRREKGASTSSSPAEIVRVLTKQTLRRPSDIGVIEHTPLDRLWFEMYNNNYRTRMEGIRYYQKEGEEFKLYNNLNSYVIFEHDSPTSVWKSGTKLLDNFNGKSKKMFQILRYEESNYNPKRMYHLNMTMNHRPRRTLLIGSKWTKIIGNSRTNLICVEEKELAEREFSKNDTLYLTKVSQQGEEDNENKFHVNFKLLMLKIWNCTDKDNSKLFLYGVMNTFTLRKWPDSSLEEIIFHDGVTVLHGEVPGHEKMNYEFTEFKYINVSDMSSVKFEGNIEMASDSGLAQVNTTLREKAAKDTAYVLNQAVPGRNEVFRTKINNKGVTLEIGERLQPDPHAGLILDLYCSNLRKDDQHKYMEQIKKIKSIGFPRILKFNSTHHPVLMTPEEIPFFFNSTQKVHWCKATEDLFPIHPTYYRIVTVLKWINSKPIGQIYHYDEVSIYDSDNELTIEEVKYVLYESETQKDGSTKQIYRKVKLVIDLLDSPHSLALFEVSTGEGRRQERTNKRHLFMAEFLVPIFPDQFSTFPEDHEDLQFIERHMYNREKINYRLDKEIWKLSNAEETGVTIKVESHFDKTINIDKFVTCMKIKDHPVADPKFNSKICLNIGSEDKEMKYVDVSEFPALKQVSQEIWNCTGAEDFIIVQNNMISTDLELRVYHKPPATVGTLFLPNGEKVLLIGDQKYLKEEQSKDGKYEYKVVKVLGSMKFVLETLPEAETFLKRTIGVPVRILAQRTRNHLWTLDSLRLLAFRDDLQLAKYPILAVHYTGDINQQYFHTKILDSGASRMFQLGRFYDKVLNAEDLHERKPLECIKFPWDSEFTPKYTPTVVEYVGMHLYTMDKQTFNEHFQVINVAVWLCTNKFNELLRVRTVFKPKQNIPIFAVRYTDGIEVEVSEDGKKLIKVNEILYMDVLALDVYRYDGNLQERIFPPIPPITESDSETENYKEDVIIVPGFKKTQGNPRKSGVAAKGGLLKGLLECLKPSFKKTKPGNSKKPSRPSPGKPKA